MKYDESEGPTKEDNGENDEGVLFASALDHNKGVEWKNPLEVRDDGTDDDRVLVQSEMQTETRSRSMMTIGEALKERGMLKELSLLQYKPRRIVDEDGDGVEDNVEKTRDELDRFYIPAVFGPAEEMHNTHHGNMPGHTRLEEFEEAPVYYDPWVGTGDLDHFSAMKVHF